MGERGSLRPNKTILDLEDFVTLGVDTTVDIASALAYIRAFMVDREPLPTTDGVRPWREGRIAEYVVKALLLLDYMNHWERWDDDALFLNMKREAIMVNHSFLYSLPFIFRLILIS